MADDNHGSTPAAWTTVVVVLVAFLVGAAGLMLGNWTVFWVAPALVVLGVLAGKVMQAMGMGAR